MNKISKFKIDKWLLICLILFSLISIFTVYSAQNLLPSYMNYLTIKQALWYIIGFGVMFLIISLGNNYIIKNAWILYMKTSLKVYSFYKK